MCNLQLALDEITYWSDSWQLPISTTKCSCLDIGFKSHTYSFMENVICGENITFTDEVRDLGITYDSSLSFSRHILAIVKSAKTRLFMMFKAFITRNVSVLLLAYKTYIRPLLEYCTVIWNSHYIGDIKCLESVQKLFTKKLLFPNTLNYKDRCALFNLDSLEKRRLHFDLIYCYKLIYGLIAGNINEYGLILVTNNLRGHNKKLLQSHSRLDARKYFFANRVTKI